MVNTSARPISVDGVRLDTLAWNITKITRATAGRRSGDYEVPNLDGAIPSLNDALEPASFGLEMWLRGTDADGGVPAAGGLDTMRTNLDELLHLFGKRHALLEVRERVSATDERRALCKLADAITPELNAPGSAGVMNVALDIPSGQWEDATATTWSAVASGASATSAPAMVVTSLTGATERVNDAVVVVRGPAAQPRLTDTATGMFVQLDRTLASGEDWRLDSGTWSSKVSTGGGFSDTGADVAGLTNVGGPARGYALPLTPVRASGVRTVSVQITAAGGIANGTTTVSVQARRKYAA